MKKSTEQEKRIIRNARARARYAANPEKKRRASNDRYHAENVRRWTKQLLRLPAAMEEAMKKMSKGYHHFDKKYVRESDS